MQQEESSTLRQPLPERWVAKIFQELQGNYGTRFLNQWKTGQQDKNGEDIGILNAMSAWGRKLAGFSDMPDALKAVLENLPPEPPTLPEFVILCRDAGRRLVDNAPRLEHHMTEEEKAKADAAAKKVADVVSKMDKRDHLAWAKKLKERDDAGEVLSLIQVNAYKEALGIAA